MKIVHVVGARPNYMKIAPIMREMAGHPHIFEQKLVHTGQHYDANMSQVFFDELGLPRPDISLQVGSGSHAWQTAQVMLRFEPVLQNLKPDWVFVPGDVNSTLACALVCSKLGVKVAHVEAGLRSFDRTMPEEINRVLTDQLADLLFTTERDANDNLLHEGVLESKIYLVGNLMVDTLLQHKERALKTSILAELALKPRGYGLLTLHRPSNVDVPEVLAGILDAMQRIQAQLPLLFVAHPRTMKRLKEFGLDSRVAAMPALRVIEPLGYLEFLNLMAQARLVLTDSGGVQEETTVLGVPCLTLRENTERPVTISEGTNTLVGCKPKSIVTQALGCLAGKEKPGRVPELWDGHAARRVVQALMELGP